MPDHVPDSRQARPRSSSPTIEGEDLDEVFTAQFHRSQVRADMGLVVHFDQAPAGRRQNVQIIGFVRTTRPSTGSLERWFVAISTSGRRGSALACELVRGFTPGVQLTTDLV